MQEVLFIEGEVVDQSETSMHIQTWKTTKNSVHDFSRGGSNLGGSERGWSIRNIVDLEKKLRH